MPRLPTMRVMGSKATSTSRRPVWVWTWDSMRGSCRSGVSASAAGAVAVAGLVRVVSGGQLGAVVMPARLAVGAAIGESPQGANQRAIRLHQQRRETRAGRLVHEGHE